MADKEDCALISTDTPLISNLNMLENIALIKEVHLLLPTSEAQKEAQELLERIDLGSIGRKRLNQCSSLEIFYVMFIRAMMTSDENISIVTPFFLIKKLSEIDTVLENISIINNNFKNITILDTQANQSHYKGELCNIIK